MAMNIYRLCGDMSRLLSIIILLRRLHTSRNAQGISLRTQELYLVVVLCRYTDLLTTFYSRYNSALKIIFIAAQCGLVSLIRCDRQISSTYDAVQDNFPHRKFLLAPCALLAVVVHFVQYYWTWMSTTGYTSNIQEVLWTNSIILESVAILPQLSLLRRYRVVDNLTGDYVFFMGLYRLLYIVNWIYRSHTEWGYRHHYVVYACGVLQTLLYIDFFYYWVISKIEGRALSYGEGGDTEYYDCDVNELRNYDNSASLIENSDLRMRAKPDTSDEDLEHGDDAPLLIERAGDSAIKAT